MADKRTITEAQVLAALANPARYRIVEIVSARGPVTAATIGDQLDLAAGSVSHHLKVLSQVGLVEEALNHGTDRRERWWRLASDGFKWRSTDFAADPAAAAAESAAANVALQRQFERTRDWLSESADPGQREWSDAAFATTTWLRLSSAELAELEQELTAVLGRWRAHGHSSTATDVERREVYFFGRAFPSTP